jgi:hypothetical protein
MQYGQTTRVPDPADSGVSLRRRPAPPAKSLRRPGTGYFFPATDETYLATA